MGEPLVTRNFVLLLCGHFLQGLGYASAPLLPLYLVHLGASRTEIGIIVATASVSGLLFRPLVGWALDGVGRKPTLVVGTLLLVIAMLCIGAVTEVGWFIYAVRLLYGVGIGALFSGYFTLAADLVPTGRRTEGLALFGVSGLLPLAVNPVVGELGLAPSQLRWVFPAIGGMVALSLAALFAVREPWRPSKGNAVGFGAMFRGIVIRRLWPTWVATIALAGLASGFLAFATVSAASRGINRPAALWWAYVAAATIVRVLGGRLPDSLGPRNLIAPAIGSYVAAMVVVAGAESAPGFLAAGMLAGLGHGYAFPVLVSQVATRAGNLVRGSAMAMFTALWEVGALATAPLLGAMADHYDDATMFAAAAVAACAILALWVGMEHFLGERRAESGGG